MATNLERFKRDLDRLIRQGQSLEYAMLKDVSKGEGFLKQLHEHLGKDKANEFLKNLPDFASTYQAWYSESLSLLRQLLPERVDNFVSFYEKPKGRKEINNGNYVIQDYLQGLTVSQYGKTVVDTIAALPQFRQQLAILKAAELRFESSLFEIRQLVRADLFDCEIEAARELQKSKFLRAAGTIPGVVLEKHLRQVCDDRRIKMTKKHPTISDLNELLKTNAVIEVPQWRHISLLADIRNICCHNKQKEPTSEQVTDLVDGTEKVLKTIS
jgi:hypothetical protein